MTDEADPRLDPSGNVRPAVEVLPEQPWPTAAEAGEPLPDSLSAEMFEELAAMCDRQGDDTVAQISGKSLAVLYRGFAYVLREFSKPMEVLTPYGRAPIERVEPWPTGPGHLTREQIQAAIERGHRERRGLPPSPEPKQPERSIDVAKKLDKAEALLFLVGLAFEDVVFVPRKQEVVMEAVRAHLRGKEPRLPTIDEFKAIVDRDSE